MENNSEYLKLLELLEENLQLSDSDDEQENVEIEPIQKIEFEIVTGFRSNSKLIWVPSENSFFKQNTYSKTFNGIAYTCHNPECKARKVLMENDTKLITISATHIPHRSMQPMYKQLFYLNQMKNMCQTEPHSVKVSTIFNKAQEQ